MYEGTVFRLCDALLVSRLMPPRVVMTVAITLAALPSATTVLVPLALAMSAPLQRSQPLPQHGRRRHELPGAQAVPPLGRALLLLAALVPLAVSAAAAVDRLAAALLGAVLAAALAAAADPAVPRHVALAAVVQVMAELGGEVARRFLEAEKVQEISFQFR